MKIQCRTEKAVRWWLVNGASNFASQDVYTSMLDTASLPGEKNLRRAQGRRVSFPHSRWKRNFNSAAAPKFLMFSKPGYLHAVARPLFVCFCAVINLCERTYGVGDRRYGIWLAFTCPFWYYNDISKGTASHWRPRVIPWSHCFACFICLYMCSFWHW